MGDRCHAACEWWHGYGLISWLGAARKIMLSAATCDVFNNSEPVAARKAVPGLANPAGK
ncbi:hypothetical protein SAMN02746095_01656 [Acidocella aminolytica 101 = DSM 11237]|jgi:hypothetical protein|nr:hypothetical protein SAMN02746095_01656 [Acidocella aminolytica 101 = DSM 11237]